MRPSLGAEALDFPSFYQPPVSDLGGLRSSQPPPERIERSSPSAHPMLDPAGVPQKIQSAHGAQTEQAGRTPQGQRVLSITPRAASLAPETYPAPTQANTRASPPRPSQPMAPSDESDSTELSELLDLIRGELPALVSLAVQEYCEKHFAALAREVISAELRKLMEEKSRHLVDN